MDDIEFHSYPPTLALRGLETSQEAVVVLEVVKKCLRENNWFNATAYIKNDGGWFIVVVQLTGAQFMRDARLIRISQDLGYTAMVLGLTPPTLIGAPGPKFYDPEIVECVVHQLRKII